MGGRGNNGSRNSSSSEPAKPVADRIGEFYEELKTREYGKLKPGIKISDDRAKEFRRAYADMVNTVESNPENMDKTTIMASGFTAYAKNPEEYVHTTQKLNNYQRLLQSEVRNTAIDLRMGIIDKDRAEIELRALKNLDAMIQRRREASKGIGIFK